MRPKDLSSPKNFEMETYLGNRNLSQIRIRPRTSHHNLMASRLNHSSDHVKKRHAFRLPMLEKPEEELGIVCTTPDQDESPPQTEGQLCLSKTGGLTPELILDLRKQYMSLKLRKLMAQEIVKDHVKGDLKRIVKQIGVQVENSKDFIVVGGGRKSLSYFKAPTPRGTGFTLEVDVRGYMPRNISVDTSNNQMTIRAVKVNGLREKALSLLAPSTKALEKVKIFPPTNGFLLLKYSNEN